MNQSFTRYKRPVFLPIDEMPPTRPVKGASRYSVSAKGGIYSWKGDRCRVLHQSGGGRGGYLKVSLSFDDGVIRSMSVHHLVAHAWLGDAPVWAECIRHIDGDNHNNASSNLAYGTYSENTNDRRKHGTMCDGAKNPMAKLTEEQMGRIREMLCHSVSVKEIARLFHVHRTTISRISRNEAWKDHK